LIYVYIHMDMDAYTFSKLNAHMLINIVDLGGILVFFLFSL